MKKIKRNIEEEINQAKRKSSVAQDEEVVVDENIKVVVWWADDECQAVDLYAYGNCIYCHHEDGKEILKKIKFIKKHIKRHNIKDIIKKLEGIK